MKSLSVRGRQVPFVALVAILMVSVASVYAWQVYYNSLATVTLTVKKASATAVPVNIPIGLVDSGADFEGTGTATVTIANAKELVAAFNVAELDDTEKAALKSLVVEIKEGEVVLGTINALDPVPFSSMLAKGDHAISVYVTGTAAYPENDVLIAFLVTITVTTPL